jgi:MFS family permease
VLAKPAYRRLFAAQTISRWGDTFNTVALVVLVFQLTGKGLGVSGVVIAEILPVLLLAPAAGVLTDRLPRVRLMVAADLWRMTLAGLLPLIDQHPLAVYLVAVGLSAGTVLFNPAASATLPAIVDEDELVAGNSALWSAAVTSQIALAPLAGLLVAAWGVAPAFWFNAATFAASAATLTGVRVPPTPPAASPATAPTRWGRRLAEVPAHGRGRVFAAFDMPGRPAGSPRWCLAGSSPTSSASRPSTSSAACCCCWPAALAWPRCQRPATPSRHPEAAPSAMRGSPGG